MTIISFQEDEVVSHIILCFAALSRAIVEVCDVLKHKLLRAGRRVCGGSEVENIFVALHITRVVLAVE
jgi:hypothetical protein